MSARRDEARESGAAGSARSAASPKSPEDRRRRSALTLAFLIAFIDLAGFSIIFPLFPAMLEHYLELEGEASLIGRLVETLRGWAGGEGDHEFLVQALFGGVLGSLYSVLQFLFAPVWGSLSDRVGRRPTLLFTLVGTALSYVAWCFAGTFAWLVFARLLGGVMAGNLATASAVVADVTTSENRSKGMGLLGAGIGLGFIFGPALGGLASQWDLSTWWPGAVRFGVNPFSLAALVALALSLVNLFATLTRFEETLPPERRGQGETTRSANPIKIFTAVRAPGVQRVNLVYFSTFLAFSAVEFTLVFLAVERFAFAPRQNAYMFVFVGLLIALVQGGALRRLAPRYGDKRLTLVGLVLIAPGFVLIGQSAGVPTLYVGLAFMAVGSALVMPCLSALVSRYSPPERQGAALGTFRSVGALSRAVGPVLGGLLYWQLGSGGPYTLGAAFLVLPLILALGLPRPAAT